MPCTIIFRTRSKKLIHSIEGCVIIRYGFCNSLYGIIIKKIWCTACCSNTGSSIFIVHSMIDTENVSIRTTGILNLALLWININRPYIRINIPLIYTLLNEYSVSELIKSSSCLQCAMKLLLTLRILLTGSLVHHYGLQLVFCLLWKNIYMNDCLQGRLLGKCIPCHI